MDFFKPRDIFLNCTLVSADTLNLTLQLCTSHSQREFLIWVFATAWLSLETP